MEKIKNTFVSKWRQILSIAFVLTVFMMPASKSIFAKFFNLEAEAGNKKEGSNKPPKPPNNGGASVSVPSVSAPSSQSTASPMSNTNSRSSSHSNSLGLSKANRPNPK